MENVEKKLDKQSEELKKLMLKVTAIQEVLDTTMLAKEEHADTFAFAPAKNEDELALFSHSFFLITQDEHNCE